MMQRVAFDQRRGLADMVQQQRPRGPHVRVVEGSLQQPGERVTADPQGKTADGQRVTQTRAPQRDEFVAGLCVQRDPRRIRPRATGLADVLDEQEVAIVPAQDSRDLLDALAS